MQSMLTIALVVVAVAGAALGADDCAPTPGKKPVLPSQCCKMAAFNPSSIKTAADKCMKKYSLGKPPGPPPSGPPTGPPPTPSAEMKNAHACTGECIFSEAGLLTSDKTLDKDAITELFTPSDASLSPVVTAAIDKCFASYTADIDSSLECKSGAHEFQRCLMKQTFINCPSSLSTASSECDDLKAKLSKCPKMPFMVGGGPGEQ